MDYKTKDGLLIRSYLNDGNTEKIKLNLLSDNYNIGPILKAIGLKKGDIDRFRDVDVPPYSRYRQLPLFTDPRFESEDKCSDKNTIVVLTRTGGSNRSEYGDNWKFIRNHPNYICDYDCSFDETYAYIEFSVDPTTLSKLKLLNSNPKPDLEKMTLANMSIVRNLITIMGDTKSEKEIYEAAKKVALATIKGDN